MLCVPCHSDSNWILTASWQLHRITSGQSNCHKQTHDRKLFSRSQSNQSNLLRWQLCGLGQWKHTLTYSSTFCSASCFCRASGLAVTGDGFRSLSSASPNQSSSSFRSPITCGMSKKHSSFNSPITCGMWKKKNQNQNKKHHVISASYLHSHGLDSVLSKSVNQNSTRDNSKQIFQDTDKTCVLACMCDLWHVYIYTWGALVYSLIWRTSVQSAQTPTLGKSWGGHSTYHRTVTHPCADHAWVGLIFGFWEWVVALDYWLSYSSSATAIKVYCSYPRSAFYSPLQ